MKDVKYISNKIEEVNDFKKKLATNFDKVCNIADKLDLLRAVTVELDYDTILKEIAHYYYFNASYDAYENYTDIEEFEYALRAEEMVELAEKLSTDGVNFKIGIMYFEDFEYRIALGWFSSAFHEKTLKTISDYVYSINPKMFEATPDSASVTEFDAFALSLFYKDAYNDMKNKLAAVYENAEKVRTSICSFMEHTEKYYAKDKAKIVCLKAIEDNNVLGILEEIKRSAM